MAATFQPNREAVTTIRPDGSHRILYPADVRGRFTTARRLSALVLMAVYAGLPWIRVGGYPAVFLDVDARRFHLFGLTLAAQDLWLLFFLITGLGFSLFFLTALLGRVWCGWACPQTVFLEHVYRRIERWVEGDGVTRQRRASLPPTAGSGARAVVKQAAFVVVSLAITHLFLAYFVSIPGLWAMMRQAPGQHWPAFAFVVAATAAIYFNFAWFREQLCIIICPYGRLQSALTDEHSLTIGYDSARGEPRGPLHEGGAGACVDCQRCVRVCPTGIDIRQGLQVECIGCAACVDACDEVMVRIGRPRGLVRYDSMAGLARRGRRLWRPRIAVYGVLLLAGMGAAAWGVSSLRPLLVGVTRMVGAPYYLDAGAVRDQFLVRLTNKRPVPVTLRLEIAGLPEGATAEGVDAPVVLAPLAEAVRPVIIQQANARYRGAFRFELRAADPAGGSVSSGPIPFLGPDYPREAR